MDSLGHNLRNFIVMTIICAVGLWLSSLIYPSMFVHDTLKGNLTDILVVAAIFTTSFYLIGSRLLDSFVLFLYNMLVLYIISLLYSNFTVSSVFSLLITCVIISLVDYLLSPEE